MSLYRTYRPRALDDLVGQEHVVTVLRQAIGQDRLSHAYLFAGTRGTGKTSTARILARHLLTRGIGDPVIREQLLKAFEEGSLVDFVEIDAASNTGVDNIRDLIEKIQFTPVVAGAKVYVIDEVHMLSKGAFNALLKTLEEPPPYAYFILATTELHKIPATVQSRCQRFLFRQIGEEDLVGRLRTIADNEQIPADDGALRAIARAAQGGMRDAISLLDQLRSLPTITAEEVAERVGETGHAFVEQMLAALDTGDRAEGVHITRALEEAGIPLDVFVRLLLGAVRDQLHAAVQAGASTATAQHRIETLLQCAVDLRAAPLPGLVLESALLSLMELGERIAESDERLAEAKSQQPNANSPQSTSLPPEKTMPSPADSLTLDAIRPLWPDVLKEIQPAAAQVSMRNGRLHALEGSTLTVCFASNFHREKASIPEGIRSAQDALHDRLGQRMTLKTVLDSDLGAPPPEPRQQAVDLADAVSDIF